MSRYLSMVGASLCSLAMISVGLLSLSSVTSPHDDVTYKIPGEHIVTNEPPAAPTPSIAERRAAAEKVLNILATNLASGKMDYQFNRSGDGVMLGAAGLAFIGHGSTLGRGPYQKALLSIQQRMQQIMDSDSFSLQPTWGCAQSTIFLAELHRTAPDALQPPVYALLQKYTDKLIKSQTSRGGWCHGFEDVKNSLNYDDLMATTVMAMQGLGMARREGATVPQKIIDVAYTYIENSSNVGNGHIGYSPRSGQKGMGGAGRAGGGLLALHACGLGQTPIAVAAAKYLQQSYAGNDLNIGHASAQLSQSWAAWWAAQAEEYPAFWAGQGAAILKRQKADGTFNCAPSDGKADNPSSERGDMANAMHALMLVAGDGFLAAGEAAGSPQAAISVAIDLVAAWGKDAPAALSEFAQLRASDKPLLAKDIARSLASTIKSLAKVEDARIAPAILQLLGPKPRYSAVYDEKSRVIRLAVSLPAIRAERVAKASMSIAYDAELMRAKVSNKSLAPASEPKKIDINISVRPENFKDQKLTAEIEWNLAGLKFNETIAIPIEREEIAQVK